MVVKNLDIENALSRETSHANLPNKQSAYEDSVEVDAKSQASRDTAKTKGSSNRTARKTMKSPNVAKLLGPADHCIKTSLLKDYVNIEE
jgi:hypothetical protein